MTRQCESLVGRRFGRLVVAAMADRGARGKIRWRCDCDCGEENIVRGDLLRGGRIRSCGCLSVDVARRRLREMTTTHGDTDSKEYRAWCKMKERCDVASAAGYANYGGRGISICERWRSYEAFLEDMGRAPSAKHSIDRVDGNGNYEKGNCRWATATEQVRNRRTTLRVIIGGVEKTLFEWCEAFKMPYHAVYLRISRRGWAPVDAIAVPLGQKRT